MLAFETRGATKRFFEAIFLHRLSDTCQPITHAKCRPVWWFVRVRSIATVKHNWNLTRRFPLNAGMIEEMSSISQKATVTAFALVSFLIGGCSDIPQSADDNWTELCKARLDKSMARPTASVSGLKRMTSLRDVMPHKGEWCDVR